MGKTVQLDRDEVQELFAQAGYADAEDASDKKLLKWVKALPKVIEKLEKDDDALDLDKKSERLADKICEAAAKKRNIEIVASDDDDDDDEEEETPKKGKKEVKTKSKKKSEKKKVDKEEKGTKKKSKKGEKGEKEKAKKGKKKSKSSGGPSTKDKIFEKWLKSTNPKKDVKKWVKEFKEVKDTTIRSWVSDWNKGPGSAVGYPRAAKGRDKEIKTAIKRQKD